MTDFLSIFHIEIVHLCYISVMTDEQISNHPLKQQKEGYFASLLANRGT